jgi:hypothetical protein
MLRGEFGMATPLFSPMAASIGKNAGENDYGQFGVRVKSLKRRSLDLGFEF